MYTREEIAENIKFIGGIIQTTLNNVDNSNLVQKAKDDFYMIDNLAISWPYEGYKYEINDQLYIHNIIMKKYLNWFTLKNRLRNKALIDKEIILDDDGIIRNYKNK